ncbi:1-phosphatidylinositol-4-phosphate 5-kinase [Strigomonas culicis]|nr:1-phosphatidylinositol-4-phosphate 5-kinase [Strigomonas culicis]|eukprot:EPY23884.1 1-phosphatidylinositol-4-phosphate 5-kinase [Strigomonas culicis]
MSFDAYSERSSDSDVDVGVNDEVQNEATKMVISCLKAGLVKSITNISRPGKRRSLHAQKDFSIKTKMRFTATSSGSGPSCCGPKATHVKSSRDVRVDGPRNGFPSMIETPSSQSGLSMHPLSEGEDDDAYDGPGDMGPASFTFTDYSPMCYQHIRDFFDVDAVTYCDVLTNSPWHSIPTPGKSAAHLFFCGRDWVIKTMNKEENDFLREILHRYYYHVRDNNSTLLPHFVGHYKLTIGSETQCFVIMQNVFATTNTIHEKFDLKGSTIGRFATDSERQRATCTQKDLDINSPIHIGAERRRLLISQIHKDCDFLKNSHIMDYSFLIGIHKLPQTGHTVQQAHTASTAPLSLATSFAFTGSPIGVTMSGVGNGVSSHSNNTSFVDPHSAFATAVPEMDTPIKGAVLELTAYQGGMLSNEVPGLSREIYYIGIIDILQRYNLRKHMETFFLGMGNGYARISCANPNDYAARFISFMSSIIV